MIECQICKRQLGTLVGKHLKSHGLSSQDYQEKFPGCPVIVPRTRSDESRKKQAAKLRGRKHSEETKAKIGAKHKGKKRSAQEIEKWQVSYQQFLEKNGGSPQKGYKRSEEFKQRMKEVAENRSPDLVQQKVEQMWAARHGSKATDQQRENYRNGRLKWMKENPDKLPDIMFNTKPEREFEKILQDNSVYYQKSVHVGRWLFDFQIGRNCLIELDGPYHRKLGLYCNINDTNDHIVSKLMNFKNRDRDKDWFARNNGYFVYRIPVGNHLPDDWLEILHHQGFVEF